MSPDNSNNRTGQIVFILLFFALISFLSCYYLHSTLQTVQAYFTEEMDFEIFKKTLNEEYTDDSDLKFTFINTNGLYARSIGKRVHNDVVLLKNGMLSAVEPRLDRNKTESVAGMISKVSETAGEQGIPFLYVICPYKEDMDGTLLPYGVESYANQNVEEILPILQEQDVNVLDLRPYMAKDAEDINQWYARTDHHWTYEGAFFATKLMINSLGDVTGERMNDTYLQEEKWEKHTLENWFLGARGKRVGTLFAGTEDFTYLTPRFETDMSYIVPKYNWMAKGSFADTIVQKEHAQNKNYFKDNTYEMYIGRDYPLSQHRNRNAPVQKKVLVIKDSFVLPVEGYLSTVFREVDVLDPRHFKTCSVHQYIDEYRPDIVMLICNAGSLTNDAFFNAGFFDKDPATYAGEEVIVTQPDARIEPKETSMNYYLLSDEIENGQHYRVQFSFVDFDTEKRADGVSVNLYNQTKSRLEQNAVFDLEYEEINGDEMSAVFYVPDTSDEYSILLYAGMAGQTENIGVTYHDVTLSKLIKNEAR